MSQSLTGAVALGGIDAAGVPEVHDVHRDLAGLERVAAGHAIDGRLGRDEVVLPDAVVVELQALAPVVRPLGASCRRRRRPSRNHRRWSTRRARRSRSTGRRGRTGRCSSASKPALVASLPAASTVSFLASSATVAQVQSLPSYCSPTLCGGSAQAGFLEQVLVVVEERRVDRHRDADLLAVDVVHVEQALGDLGQVDARGRDVRGQVQQLVAERLQGADADRAR